MIIWIWGHWGQSKNWKVPNDDHSSKTSLRIMIFTQDVLRFWMTCLTPPSSLPHLCPFIVALETLNRTWLPKVASSSTDDWGIQDGCGGVVGNHWVVHFGTPPIPHSAPSIKGTHQSTCVAGFSHWQNRIYSDEFLKTAQALWPLFCCLQIFYFALAYKTIDEC